MRVGWYSDWNMKGNGYGYSNHNREMRKWVQEHGVEISDHADMAIQIVVPTGFEPVPGKFNILFTMYEGQIIPKDWIPHLQRADLLIVPCRHNQEIFRNWYKGPIEVCQEGFDPTVYNFEERHFPKLTKEDPFIYLWVGASNPRKGYEHIIIAWQEFMRRHKHESDRSMLIMKTTQINRQERLVSAANVRIETHDYTLEALRNLYGIAHCFLFPTMGEGWGLTLMEAAATGLPCVYTDFSGPRDFMVAGGGYPLRWKPKYIDTVTTAPTGERRPYHRTVAASADPMHLIRRMIQVFHGYENALSRGRKQAEHIHRNFTWSQAGERLAEILAKYEGAAAKKARGAA